MASSDATPFPIKNQAYRVTFPILDADGDLVAGATGLDSEISKDGGTFVDCTNEATEIATSSGMYYLDLTNTEMNADTVSIIIKTSSSGAKTTPIVMYPVEDADIPVNIKAIDDDTTAPGILKLQYNGTGIIGDTYPFTQSGGAALGGGISIKTTMVSVTVIQGSQQDLANTNTSDDSRWTGDDDASGAEFIFRCTPVSTSSIPVELSFEGYYDEPTGGENGATLQVYNFNTAGWDTIITLSNSNKDEKHQVPLSHAHKAPGGGTLETVAYTIGDVLLKFKQDTTETGNAVLLIDYMVVGFVNGLVTALDIVDEWESQSQSDPTGFHVNVKEVNGTAQTAGNIISVIGTAQSDLDIITGTGGVLIGTDAMDRSGTLDVNAKTLGADCLTATKIADNAFSAEHFNTNCLTSDALDASFVTEIWDKAMIDMAAGAPSATATVLLAINWIYEICRNKVVTDKTNNEIIVYKDNSTTKLAESDISDDGTLFTRGKFGVVD